MNKPVAWMHPTNEIAISVKARHANVGTSDWIPLYTHPVKELHLSLQKEKETGELLAVTYTDDEHRIVEVLWQRPPVKELTDEEICKIFNEHTGLGIHQKEADKYDLLVFARAILLKAQEK